MLTYWIQKPISDYENHCVNLTHLHFCSSFFQVTFSQPVSGYYFFVIKYWQFNLIIPLHFQRKRKG